MDRKPIFDSVRQMIGRKFRQAEVDRLDHAIDGAIDGAIDSAARPDSPDPRHCPQSVSPAGVELIKSFEGCARRIGGGMVEAYPDPGTGGAPWTIGWGATGPGIGPGTKWSQAQCDARLEVDIARHAKDVIRAIGSAPTSQAQFDALVSFHYNTGAIHSATLTRKHLAGDHAGALLEFGRWKMAGGRVLKGLVRRRKAEAALYHSGQ